VIDEQTSYTGLAGIFSIQSHQMDIKADWLSNKFHSIPTHCITLIQAEQRRKNVLACQNGLTRTSTQGIPLAFPGWTEWGLGWKVLIF
jgi:hypothetical protein